MLTDEVAQVHRSPGFITSNLIGKRDDGVMIKEYEASHGTVADMWEDHLAGKETSLNPLGMVEALVAAMCHAESLNPPADGSLPMTEFAMNLRSILHSCMVQGQGTRDLCGPEGLSTAACTRKRLFSLGCVAHTDGGVFQPHDGTVCGGGREAPRWRRGLQHRC